MPKTSTTAGNESRGCSHTTYQPARGARRPTSNGWAAPAGITVILTLTFRLGSPRSRSRPGFAWRDSNPASRRFHNLTASWSQGCHGLLRLVTGESLSDERLAHAR